MNSGIVIIDGYRYAQPILRATLACAKEKVTKEKVTRREGKKRDSEINRSFGKR